jgi:hypothetical protein
VFDDMARSVAGTLSGVFGDTARISRGQQAPWNIRAIVRKDIELLDDQGQVVTRTNTIRIAHIDTEIIPLRGDRVDFGCATYTLGRRLADDGYAYVFEATL